MAGVIPTKDLAEYYNYLVEEGIAECKLCKQRLKITHRSYNLKLHIMNIHMNINRQEVDKYFKVNLCDNVAVCRTCNQHVKNRLGNIRQHMRRYHNAEINFAQVQASQYSENLVDVVRKSLKRKLDEQTAADRCKRTTHRLFIKMDEKTIVRSVIGLIVEDGLCPKLFSSDNFHAVLRPMCESISAKQGKKFDMREGDIESIINTLANSVRNDFSNELSCRLLTIKIDNDLGPWQNVFSVRALFIDEAEVQSRTLGLIELKGVTELQEDHIKYILYKFNIDSNQITSVFWDNSKSKYEKEINNTDYLEEIEIFKSYPELYMSDVKIESYLNSSAQLCLLDIFKNPQILQSFLECRNLVKYLNDQSEDYKSLFDSNEAIFPQLDSPWNAGSTVSMINNLLAARSFLQPIKFEIPEEANDPFKCKKDLWLFMEAFSSVTNYLQETILNCYSEELHIGDFYAQWLKCKLLTERCSGDSANHFTSTILKDLLESIENTTQQLLRKEYVTACLYLDPRFQHTLSAFQKKMAVEFLQKLWCRSRLYMDDDAVPKNDADQVLADEDDDAFLNEFLSHDLPVNDKASNEVFQKIEELTLTFQTVDTNILSFWKGLKSSDPEIYTLSTICFAIPATEIYNKIYYTNVYCLTAKSEMSAFTKESLLYLRLNAHLLDDAVAQLHLANDEQCIYSLNTPDDEEGPSVAYEDSDSNSASTMTAVSENMPKSSNADTPTTFADVRCNEVKIEEFSLS